MWNVNMYALAIFDVTPGADLLKALENIHLPKPYV